MRAPQLVDLAACRRRAKLVDLAKRNGTTQGDLLPRMREDPRAPALVKLSSRTFLVDVEAFEAWLRELETSPEIERQRAMFVRELGRSPVRPAPAPRTRGLPIRRGTGV